MAKDKKGKGKAKNKVTKPKGSASDQVEASGSDPLADKPQELTSDQAEDPDPLFADEPQESTSDQADISDPLLMGEAVDRTQDFSEVANETGEDSPEHYNKPSSSLAVVSLIRRHAVPILVAFLVIYILYSLLIGNSKKPAVKKKGTVVAGKPVEPQLTIEQLAAVDHTLQQQVFELREQNADNQKQLHDLHQESVQLRHAISEFKMNVATLSKQVHSMVAQNKLDLEQAMKKFVTKLAETKKGRSKLSKKIVIPKIRYNVRAIVPGRAWLQSPSGRTITVKVGDRLMGYGLVKRIEPRSGTVLTTSGVVLRYGHHDS